MGGGATHSPRTRGCASPLPEPTSSSSHPLLQEAAREFFERRERAFRPTIVILAARALQAQRGGRAIVHENVVRARF